MTSIPNADRNDERTDDGPPDLAADRPLEASVSGAGDHWTLVLEKDLRHPAATIWPWLTDPGRLAQWSPAVPDRALLSAGPATARENPGDDAVDCEVLAVDPPQELMHRWGDQTLRWSLTDTDTGCRLRLEHTFSRRDVGPLAAAGWHVCLAVLSARTDGRDVGRIVGQDAMAAGWPALHAAYTAALAPSDPLT